MLLGTRSNYGHASQNFILKAFVDLAKVATAGDLETALYVIILYVKYALIIHQIASNASLMQASDPIQTFASFVLQDVKIVCFQQIAAQFVKKTLP